MGEQRKEVGNVKTYMLEGEPRGAETQNSDEVVLLSWWRWVMRLVLSILEKLKTGFDFRYKKELLLPR